MIRSSKMFLSFRFYQVAQLHEYENWDGYHAPKCNTTSERPDFLPESVQWELQ